MRNTQRAAQPAMSSTDGAYTCTSLTYTVFYLRGLVPVLATKRKMRCVTWGSQLYTRANRHCKTASQCKHTVTRNFVIQSDVVAYLPFLTLWWTFRTAFPLEESSFDTRFQKSCASSNLTLERGCYGQSATSLQLCCKTYLTQLGFVKSRIQRLFMLNRKFSYNCFVDFSFPSLWHTRTPISTRNRMQNRFLAHRNRTDVSWVS